MLSFETRARFDGVPYGEEYVSLPRAAPVALLAEVSETDGGWVRVQSTYNRQGWYPLTHIQPSGLTRATAAVHKFLSTFSKQKGAQQANELFGKDTVALKSLVLFYQSALRSWQR